MYAIIAAGGRQYRVSQGDVIYIDKVNQEADEKISFDVLMIGDEGKVKVGTPVLAGAKVEGKVLAQVKGEKVIVYKYKSKKNYARKSGHRQPYTKVEITAINA
jgi:large subunit ribosomal protein L21